MSRVFNFSAGPAVLPEEVLKEAADEMLDYRGDYCVKNTIANLIKYKSPTGLTLDVNVLLDGIASIDDGTTIKEYCKENSLPIVEAKEYEYFKG